MPLESAWTESARYVGAESGFPDGTRLRVLRSTPSPLYWVVIPDYRVTPFPPPRYRDVVFCSGYCNA
jgi:hypothetical protein